MHTIPTLTQLQPFTEDNLLLHQTADGRVSLARKGVCIRVIQCALINLK